MAVATFDTSKFANTLKEAGVPPMQAEAQARAFAEVIPLNFKEVAARGDLAVVEKSLTQEITASEQRQTGRLDKVEAQLSGGINLLRWMLRVNMTIGVATLGIVVRLLMIR